LNAKDAVAQYRLGAEYLRTNDPAAAQAPLEKAYALQPGDQSTLNALQMSLRRQGKTAEANARKEQLAELLRKRDQENQDALKALKLNNDGAALEKAGDLAGAVRKYSEALTLNPTHNGIRVNHAVALLRSGQWTEGLNELHDALMRDPDNESIQAAMRDALRQAPASAVPHWHSE
jgi:tetratricopeptide (TPR) repeat protein